MKSQVPLQQFGFDEAVSVSKPRPFTETPAVAAGRSASVVAWGIWGAVWVGIVVNACVRWVLSGPGFGPVPVLAGDVFEPWRMIALRGLEVGSTLVVLYCVWVSIIRPWSAGRKFGLDGMLLIGGVFGFCADAILNLHAFLFAFNAHSINLNVWTKFLPFYTGGPSSYAESLLWGFPMYVYFGLGASWIGCALIAKLRVRFPDISDASAYAAIYLLFVAGDFLIENSIIRTSQAYMFPQTYGPLTLFAGSIYQFPIYESLCVGIVCWSFTMIRQSALDDADGLSFVERGSHRVSPAFRFPLRMLAIIGASGAIFILGFHLPFNWLGIVGSSIVHLPSYMLPS